MAQIIVYTMAVITWLTIMWLLLSGISLIRTATVSYKRYLFMTSREVAERVIRPEWPRPGKGT